MTGIGEFGFGGSMEKMILPYRRYFDFSGRSSRSEYWLFHLLLVILLFGAIAVKIELVGLIFLGSIIPHLSVTIRRFHDQSMSGWNYLWTFFPYIGGFISIYFMVQPGTQGENAWGDDPLNPGFDVDIFS